MPQPWKVRTTTSVLVAALAVAGVGVAVAAQRSEPDIVSVASVGLLYLAYVSVGLLILRSDRRHRVGRLMLFGGGVAAVGSAALEVAYLTLQRDPGNGTAAFAATIGSAARGFGWLLVVLVLPFVFPDGQRAGPQRLASFSWWTAVTTVGVFTFVALFSPHLTDTRMGNVDNPIGLPASLAGPMDAMAGLALLFGIATIALAIVCLVWRFRHGGPLRRQQVVLFGLAFAPPVIALAFSIADIAPPWLFAVVSLPLPVAIGVACLQHRLYDVNLVLNRSLTYGTLWLLIAGLYAVTVGGIGALLRQRGASWLPWVAAGVVAVSFAPLRDGLQRGANKLTYGQWSQPAEVLAATGRRLVDATDVDGLLDTLAAELGDGLQLSFVKITDSSGRTLASHGTQEGATDQILLQAYGTPVGTLSWSRRRLRDADRSLLSDLAGQLGAVVHAESLHLQLMANQERLVAAREEERKRLRRDLHDGLGPALAGLTLRVDTLRNQLHLPHDRGLLELRADIQGTLLDVRRIVEGLRPPALDELGLPGALDQLAGRLSDDGQLAIEVSVTGRALPAAVEVAAYRIVQEALTNTVRHADAAHVSVSLQASEAVLDISIADDGIGTQRPRADGIGLLSMRERAEEIGGTLRCDAVAGKGTTVLARLPLSAPASPRVPS